MMSWQPSFAKDILIPHVLRHLFSYASIGIHAIALLWIYYFFVYIYQDNHSHIKTFEQQAKVEESLQKTTASAMQKKIDNLQKMKDLLEESTGKKPSSTQQHTPDVPQSPEELFEQAKKLANDIQTIEQQLKAEELSRVLQIPKAEALDKIKAQEAQTHKDKIQENKPDLSLKFFEDQARNALQQRQEQLTKQQEGTSVKTDNDIKDQTQQQKNQTANTKSQSQHQKEKGEGDGQQKGHGDQHHNQAQQKQLGQRHSNSSHQTQGENSGDGSADSNINKIINFLDDDIPLPQNMSGNAWTVGGDSSGEIPEVSDRILYKGSGVSLGKDGDYSNRFFVNNWYIIGPFAGNKNRIYSANPHYPPEQAVVLDAVYQGKNNRLLSWQFVNSPTYPVIPPILEEDAVYYGYTEIRADEECDLWAWLGADDEMQLWLNNQVVYPGNPTGKGWFFYNVYGVQKSLIRKWNLTEAKRQLHFKKGINRLFFKLSNGPEHTFFSMLLTRREY